MRIPGKVISAERKVSAKRYNRAGSRVIVARLANCNDNASVMNNKMFGGKHKQYEKVCIHADQSTEVILQACNFKKIIDSVRRGCVEDFVIMNGSRVVSKTNDI